MSEQPSAVLGTSPSPQGPAKPAQRLSATVLKNVSSNWAGIVINIGLSFVIAPLTVNSLGSTYYGIWTLLMQFTGYLWLFDFGVREAVVKYVAQYHAAGDREQVVSTVNTAVSLYTVVVALVALVVIALAVALPYAFTIPEDTIWTARLTALLFGASIAQGFVFNVFTGVLMGLQKFYLMARLGILLGFVRAALVYGLLTAGYGIVALALLQCALTLVTGLLTIRFCMTELPYLTIRWVRPDGTAVTRFIRYGKYVLMTNIGDKIIFATDSLVIGVFLPISALTYYAIGGSLLEQLRAFLGSMGVVLNPLASSLDARADSRAAVGRVLLSGAKGAMLIGLPFCVGFILLGETFISLWMGEAYGPQSGMVLTVLTIGQLAGLPYFSIAGVLYGVDKHRILAQSRVVEAVLNLVMSLLLVKPFGLLGVAIGTAVPQIIVVGILLPLVLPSLVPVDLRHYYLSTYGRPFVASLPFWVACWLVAHVARPEGLVSFFLFGMLCLPVYIVPCWFVALAGNERQFVRENLGRRFARRSTSPVIPAESAVADTRQ